jgi:hypothetical protein
LCGFFHACKHGNVRTWFYYNSYKKFVLKKLLCMMILHILQDLIMRNGQKSQPIWERIEEHYNKTWPTNCKECLARSLETKWGLIKHNIAKFCNNYQVVVTLSESTTSNEVML